MIRILLADDHPIMLRGLCDLVNAHDDLQVVGSELELGNIVSSVGQLKPDVLVIDYIMDDVMSPETIREVVQHSPDTSVVVLSMLSERGYVWEALTSGARGYVLKSAGDKALVQAIRKVHAGYRYLSEPLSLAELDSYSRDRLANEQESLTKRELEVLKLVAEGHTSNEIASRLRIGRRTVDTHRASILAKLGQRNQAGLVRYALERGLIGERSGSF